MNSSSDRQYAGWSHNTHTPFYSDGADSASLPSFDWYDSMINYSAGASCASTGIAAAGPHGAQCRGGRGDVAGDYIYKLAQYAPLGSALDGGASCLNAMLPGRWFTTRNAIERVGAQNLVNNQVCQTQGCKLENSLVANHMKERSSNEGDGWLSKLDGFALPQPTSGRSGAHTLFL